MVAIMTNYEISNNLKSMQDQDSSGSMFLRVRYYMKLLFIFYNHDMTGNFNASYTVLVHHLTYSIDEKMR